jgi:large subunit ribosomal protein L10
MDNPRSEKVAVVDEVRERLGGSSASVVTEYRGLSVSDLKQLRQSLSAVGGDYKIFKNTLVRLAVANSEHAGLESLLTGPTAITFVQGDVSAVAKALRDFARANPNLVVKGGLLEGNVLSSAELTTLADLPSREILLASLAGAIAAPLRQLASLMQALPRNLAYGLSALAEQRGAGEPAPADEPATEQPATEQPATDEPATEQATAEQATAEQEPQAADTSEAPADAAPEADASAAAADSAAEGSAEPADAAAPAEGAATAEGTETSEPAEGTATGETEES